MKQQMKTSEIGHRNANTTGEYWTLKLFLNGELIRVHTSKSRGYIMSLAANWK
jgi:hypothetical protein